ncbi:MAG TPA: hypothetical protein VEI07_25045 [Planctomycetaceae bacterium]|nr:hypothetical protein [Planctomycetaceae bacterium]
MYGNLRSRADAPSTARPPRIPSYIRRVNLVATQFGKRLALIAFATAILRGLFCGADFFATMQTALVSLGAFYLLGLVLGEAARRIVEENVKSDLARHMETALESAATPRPA